MVPGLIPLKTHVVHGVWDRRVFAGALAAQTDIGARAAPCRASRRSPRASLTTMRIGVASPELLRQPADGRSAIAPPQPCWPSGCGDRAAHSLRSALAFLRAPGLASSPRKVRVLRASEAELHLQANEPWR